MRRIISSLVFLTAVFSSPFLSHAQDNGGGQNGNQGNQNQQNQVGGILIDAGGVVKPLTSKPASRELAEKRQQSLAEEHLPADLNETSSMRKVSLRRLESAYEAQKEEGKDVPLEMRYLAGLQRIDFVFLDPENGDLILAGPAEGFGPDDVGRVVGLESGRPPLQLEDLLIALRTEGKIRCSIDPVPENLQKLRRYIRANSSPSTTAVAKRRYRVMAKILGMQKVSVDGVPEDSHFAQALVEADLRMKRIAMGLDRPRVGGFHSHLDMLKPRGNSIQRWWFIPFYKAIERTEEGTAFQMKGQRAQLLSQQEVVDGAGRRSNAPFMRVSTKKFAQHFTAKFPELAEKVPAFAKLQNLFDLAIVGALIREGDFLRKVDWKMDVFLDEGRSPIQSYPVAKQVQSVFSYKMAGSRMVIGLLGGGVTLDARKTLRQARFQVNAGRLAGMREIAVKSSQSDPLRWWWD